MLSWSLIKYVLIAAVRDRLVMSMLTLIILGVSLSFFMGAAAIIEKHQFTLVFAAGGLRFAGVLGLVLFVVSHVRRSFEHKDIEFLLSRPISRTQFLLSFAAAFSVIAIILALAIGSALMALSPEPFADGSVFWAASLIVEFVIMANAALFFSMWISSTSSAAMITLAFYVLARMMGQVLGIIDNNPRFEGFEVSIQVVSAITPRLDLMGQTSWLLYGVEGSSDGTFLVLQAVVFSALLLLAALFDLIRRQF